MFKDNHNSKEIPNLVIITRISNSCYQIHNVTHIVYTIDSIILFNTYTAIGFNITHNATYI